VRIQPRSDLPSWLDDLLQSVQHAWRSRAGVPCSESQCVQISSLYHDDSLVRHPAMHTVYVPLLFEHAAFIPSAHVNMGRRCSSCHPTFATSSHRCPHVSTGSNALRHFIKNALGRPTENVVSRNDRTLTVELTRGDVDTRRDQPSRCALLLPLSFYSLSRSPANTEGFPSPYESHSLQPGAGLLGMAGFLRTTKSAKHFILLSPPPARRRDRNEYPFPFPCAPDRHYCCGCPAGAAPGSDYREYATDRLGIPMDRKVLRLQLPVLRRDSKRVRSTRNRPPQRLHGVLFGLPDTSTTDVVAFDDERFISVVASSNEFDFKSPKEFADHVLNYLGKGKSGFEIRARQASRLDGEPATRLRVEYDSPDGRVVAEELLSVRLGVLYEIGLRTTAEHYDTDAQNFSKIVAPVQVLEELSCYDTNDNL